MNEFSAAAPLRANLLAKRARDPNKWLSGRRQRAFPALPANRQTLKEHPPAKFGLLARLSRGPKRSVLEYVSIGPQRKRSQNPKSAGVVTG
jgi:hypothetical protein